MASTVIVEAVAVGSAATTVQPVSAALAWLSLTFTAAPVVKPPPVTTSPVGQASVNVVLAAETPIVPEDTWTGARVKAAP
jgi:hypothetical protein